MLLVSVGLRFLYPGADSSQSSGLAVVSSSGARYYLQDGQWHPIANRTSARLLGDSSTATMKISDSDLAKYSQGQALGIPDAPEDVPSTASRMSADWTSCAISEHTFTWIDDGPDLTTWSVDEPGGAMASYPQNNGSLRQGSIVAVKDTGTTTYYVLVSSGHAYPLSPLAAALYEGTTAAPNGTIEGALALQPGAFAQSFTVAQTDIEPSPFPSEWAQLEGLYPFDSDSTGAGSDDDNPKVIRVRDQVPCASLDRGQSAAGTPNANKQAASSAHATLTVMSQDGARRASWNLDPTANVPASYSPGAALVKSGYGTLAQGSSNGQSDPPLTFVSDLGLRHSLGEDQNDTLQRLGWNAQFIQPVPEQWLELIPTGVELSNRAARREVAGGGRS